MEEGLLGGGGGTPSRWRWHGLGCHYGHKFDGGVTPAGPDGAVGVSDGVQRSQCIGEAASYPVAHHYSGAQRQLRQDSTGA